MALKKNSKKTSSKKSNDSKASKKKVPAKHLHMIAAAVDLNEVLDCEIDVDLPFPALKKALKKAAMVEQEIIEEDVDLGLHTNTWEVLEVLGFTQPEEEEEEEEAPKPKKGKGKGKGKKAKKVEVEEDEDEDELDEDEDGDEDEEEEEAPKPSKKKAASKKKKAKKVVEEDEDDLEDEDDEDDLEDEDDEDDLEDVEEDDDDSDPLQDELDELSTIQELKDYRDENELKGLKYNKKQPYFKDIDAFRQAIYEVASEDVEDEKPAPKKGKAKSSAKKAKEVVTKPTKKAGKKSRYGHTAGSQAALMDDLIFKGSMKSDIIDAIGEWQEDNGKDIKSESSRSSALTMHIKNLEKKGLEIKKMKNGKLKCREAKLV